MNHLSIGINAIELPIDKSINFTYKENIDENSYSGIALALAEYEQLIDKKLTDSNVLAIGGIEDNGSIIAVDVEYILNVAKSSSIDTIIVSSSSLESINAYQEKNNTNFNIISYQTIEELLNSYSTIVYESNTITFGLDEYIGTIYDCSIDNKKISTIKEYTENNSYIIEITGKKKGNTVLTCSYGNTTYKYDIYVDSKKNVSYSKK